MDTAEDEISLLREQRARLRQRVDNRRRSAVDLLPDAPRDRDPSLTLRQHVPTKVESTEENLHLYDRSLNSNSGPVPGLRNPDPAVNSTRVRRDGKSVGNVARSENGGGHAQLSNGNGHVSNGNSPLIREGFERSHDHQIVSVQNLITRALSSASLAFPIDSAGLARRLKKEISATDLILIDTLGASGGTVSGVELALRHMASGDSPSIEIETFTVGGKTHLMVLDYLRPRTATHPDSTSFQPRGGFAPPPHPPWGLNSPNIHNFTPPPRHPFGYGGVRSPSPWGGGPDSPGGMRGRGVGGGKVGRVGGEGGGEDEGLELEELLSKKSFKEMEKCKEGEELLSLLHKPTAKETATAAKFKSKGGSVLREYCPHLTKDDCRRQRGFYAACQKLHFRRIGAPHTDFSLGDCSFLDTCRHMKTCRFVHYTLDSSPQDHPPPHPYPPRPGDGPHPRPRPYPEPHPHPNTNPHSHPNPSPHPDPSLREVQWVNCDIRNFKMEVLGQFGVIMADPPWDIHMELPYGTMADDEMRNLNVPVLQTDGLMFLWVTGRAMELGRECLELWGYKRVEELIWVKTNQLQRIIRTGRTGHWLNHSKEHCLIGIKGNPVINRNLDTDVLVAEVRETSRKPDEMYALIERMSPNTRKLEMFARPHNTHPGWISVGNQLDGVRLVDSEMRLRFKDCYPNITIQPPFRLDEDPKIEPKIGPKTGAKAEAT